MLDRIQAFLQNLTADRPEHEFSSDDPRVAFAALCFQVMEADGQVSKSELQRLEDVLGEHYGLSKGQLESLIEAGHEAGREAVDYFRFTSDLKRHLAAEQCTELLGILWDLVYADGDRSEMEDHVIWRVADLLGVSSRDRVLLRQQAALRAESKSVAGRTED